MHLAIPANDHEVKIQVNEKRSVLKPCQRTEKTIKHKCDGGINYICDSLNDSQKLGKGGGRVRNRRRSREYPNYSIIEVSQNTERRPGNLRRFANAQ